VNPERKYQVIVGPHVSEKASGLAELSKKQIVFKVLPTATKNEIKEAVEFLFKVKVDSVHVLNVKPQKKMFGRVAGTRKAWKKAYVSLQSGFDINFSTAE
jgi:large subunit ribosomal protein L23